MVLINYPVDLLKSTKTQLYMSLITRLSNGWSISMRCFKVLKENRELVLFPILSGASMIVLTGSFVIAAVFATNIFSNLFEYDNRGFAYLLAFAFYLINYFIVVFFNVALMHCVRQYFRGEEVVLRDGLNFSVSRLGVILSWSILAATVGTILKIVQEETGIVGKIITGILGVIWNIATFFVVPVLAYENAGPIDAFKRSAQIMKEKWGESLGGNFSFGLVQFVGIILIAIPLFLLGSLINVMVGAALAVFASMLIIAIISAAQAIFISAVYHRVAGEEVPTVTNEQVDGLFETKRKKIW